MTNDEEHDTHKAILYATYLAERDGMLPREPHDVAIDWARVTLRDGTKHDRIRTVTFHGERYSVAVHLPGWAYDGTPHDAAPH
jgi:hypothetical protein